MGSQEALDLFDTALTAEQPHLIPARLDLNALRSLSHLDALPALFTNLIHATTRRHADNDLTAHSKTALAQRLHGLSTEQQQTVLRDLVRSHIATVLGAPTTEDINPDHNFQDLGLDSLTAIELRNRLKTATGLTLSPTLIFDYPTPTTLSQHLHQRLAGTVAQTTTGPADAEIQRLVASIPVNRLRQAGVLDILLGLAGTADHPNESESAETKLANMGLDDLVTAALQSDDV